jgi:hypothetical protein
MSIFRTEASQVKSRVTREQMGVELMSEPTTDTRDPDLAKLKAEMDAAARGTKHSEMVETQRRYDTYVRARRRYAAVWHALTPQDQERVKVGLLPTGEPVITGARCAQNCAGAD